MKVLAGLVTQGTGSIGGMTMSNNKAGYYLRARTVPTNPRTALQTAIRSGLAALSGSWSSLTSAQQAAWNLYGQNVTVVLNNGTSAKLSGHNWYVGANQLQLQAGAPTVLDGPTTFTMATPIILAAPTFGSSVTVNGSLVDPPTTASSDDQLMLFISKPVGLGVAKMPTSFRYVNTTQSQPSTTQAIVVPRADFGAYDPSTTTNSWVKVVRILSDGRYSTPSYYGPFSG
jgi:hypothetical protein